MALKLYYISSKSKETQAFWFVENDWTKSDMTKAFKMMKSSLIIV